MRYAVVAAMAVMLAPFAQAQEGCDVLKQAVAAAPTSFAAIRGAEVDDDLFRPLVAMPGASGCAIDLAEVTVFHCTWDFETRAASEAKLTSLTAATRACLAGWSESASAAGFISFAGPGVHEATEVNVYPNTQLGRDTPSVTIEVIRFD